MANVVLYARIKKDKLAKVRRSSGKIQMNLGNNIVSQVFGEVKFKDKAEADKYVNSIECKHFMDVVKEIPIEKPPKPVNVEAPKEAKEAKEAQGKLNV